MIYVTNKSSDNVSVINGITKTVIATIRVGWLPYSVAVNPDTNTIYVANSDSNTVSVIDGISNKVINTIIVGKNPWSLAVNADTNTLYVTNFGSNTVSVITNPNSTLNAQVSTDPLRLLKKTVNDQMDNIFTKLEDKYQYTLSNDYTISDSYKVFLNSVKNKINILLQSLTLSERNRVILNEVKSRIDKKLHSMYTVY